MRERIRSPTRRARIRSKSAFALATRSLAIRRGRSFNCLCIRDEMRSAVTENCKVRKASYRVTLQETLRTSQSRYTAAKTPRKRGESSLPFTSFYPVVERYRLPASATRAFTAHPEEPTGGSSSANFAPESDNYRRHAAASLPSFPVIASGNRMENPRDRYSQTRSGKHATLTKRSFPDTRRKPIVFSHLEIHIGKATSQKLTLRRTK